MLGLSDGVAESELGRGLGSLLIRQMASPDVLKEYEGRVNKVPDILLAEVVLTRTWNRE